MARILLVDDDEDFSGHVQEQLEAQGHKVRWLDSPEDALRLLAAEPFDLILLDNHLPGMSGLEFLPALKGGNVHLPVILITSSHSDRTAIQAMKQGAFAYVLKPDDLDAIVGELEPVLREALEVTRRLPPVPLPSPAEEPADESTLIGRSKPMLEVLMRIGRLVRTDETVLILGETGTGKDLVARALHTNSPRQDRPFVAMNCTAFDENLLHSELFGHEKGAFTGADKMRKGRFEHAHGGTLFLDEVGDMPAPLQAKLLRVLENREVTRMGSNEPIRVDVRVLAATHRDLKALVREGKFREDLFYRLEGMTIHLPPLRERAEDIEQLARSFLGRMFGGSASAPALHPRAVERLRAARWPGNIRQLQKVLCRAAGACHGNLILEEDLDFGELDSVGTDGDAGARAALRGVVEWAWKSEQVGIGPRLQDLLQRELLQYALSQPRMAQETLADRLGMSRGHLRKLIKEYGLGEPGG